MPSATAGSTSGVMRAILRSLEQVGEGHDRVVILRNERRTMGGMHRLGRQQDYSCRSLVVERERWDFVSRWHHDRGWEPGRVERAPRVEDEDRAVGSAVVE